MISSNLISLLVRRKKSYELITTFHQKIFRWSRFSSIKSCNGICLGKGPNNKLLTTESRILKSLRSFCSDAENEENKKKPPLLMSFDPIVRPEILLAIKNWILVKIIIQPYLDRDFAVKDFVRGAKQALVVISSYLANGNFESLKGLVAEEALSEIKQNYCKMSVKERQDLSVKFSDILFSFPYQIGIMFDETNQRRFCEVTMVYHILKGFEDMRNMDRQNLQERAKEDVTICNYRFIREYTKGVQSEWTVNRLCHFRMSHLES